MSSAQQLVGPEVVGREGPAASILLPQCSSWQQGTLTAASTWVCVGVVSYLLQAY